MYLPADMTEELLEVHKAEILRFKSSYELYKDMYDKLARRQKLWDEYLDLEVITFIAACRVYIEKALSGFCHCCCCCLIYVTVA